MVLLICGLLLQDQIVYRHQADLKQEEVNSICKILKARISDYGYRGITVRDGINKTIIIECDIPFTDTMRPKLDEFCFKKATMVEIKFVYPMSNAELDQYKPGVRSPQGTSWLKYPYGWIAFRNEPVLDVTKQFSWKPAKQGAPFVGNFNENLMHLAWNETATKKLLEYREWVPKCRLFIDGEFINNHINITWTGNTMKWTFQDPEGWDILGVCLNHPLPYVLKKSE